MLVIWEPTANAEASDNEPAELYFKDFDNNGSVDPFLCFYIQGKSYPYVTRDELLEQIGSLRSRYTNYKSYADVTLSQLFKTEELKDAGHLAVNHLETTLFISGATDKFEITPLPIQAQYAPVHTINILDYNNDGYKDLLLCGNRNNTKLKIGKFDANYGVLLKGNANGNFQYIDQNISGLKLKGDVRSVLMLNNTFVFGVTQQPLKAYRLVN